jgi:hypothetical protein
LHNYRKYSGIPYEITKAVGSPLLITMVHQTGLEPVRLNHTLLRRARMPIPPLVRDLLYNYNKFLLDFHLFLKNEAGCASLHLDVQVTSGETDEGQRHACENP